MDRLLAGYWIRILVRRRCALTLMCISATSMLITACGGGGSPASISPTVASGTQVAQATATASPLAGLSGVAMGTKRTAFLGAFFRPEGAPPFGVFSAQSSGISPQPYPSPSGVFLGPTGYCTQVAANGVSIESGNLVDATKLSNIVSLGVRWVRLSAPQFFDDDSHVFGAGQYSFADFDSAQCSTLAEHGIKPVIELAAGPVQYNATPGTFSPATIATYQTPADFGSWCGAVAIHEKIAFPSVSQYSLPGNEVNDDPQLFPGGEQQIAAYAEACYSAIKAANPASFVYGFELNMDGNLNTPQFVSQMVALGCKVGTCYDGIAMHLSLRYPIPAASTPCYPSAGGDYGMLCINAIQTAAQAPIHVLISETVVTIPSSVPDEATKATAVVADFNAFAGNSSVDGVNYANVDECALYPTGVFSNGCLVNIAGQALPAFYALQQLAQSSYQ